MTSATPNSYSYHINTGARDEAGGEYAATKTQDIDGIWFIASASNAASDYDVVLYEGSTPTTLQSIDATQTMSTSGRLFIWPIPRRTITSGNTYKLIIKATTTSAVVIYSLSLSASGHVSVQPGGADFMFTSRVDGGSWTTSTTEKALCGFRFCSVPDAGGGGGAIPPFNGLLVTR